jgi:hypothetical protein
VARPLTIPAPGGARLAGWLHEPAPPARAPLAALIVPGAPQTRVGPHRSFAALAQALAAAGVPALSFDRRGLGDSDGTDPGFRAIGPDVAAARAALLAATQARCVIGIGLCDGAAALALEPEGFAGLLLLNPWARDACTAAAQPPPRAAIAARYRERLHPLALARRALSGDLDLRKAAHGLARLARPEPLSATAREIAATLGRYRGAVEIVTGSRDATGIAFSALWGSTPFKAARAAGPRTLTRVEGAGHSFAGAAAQAAVHARARALVESCSAC